MSLSELCKELLREDLYRRSCSAVVAIALGERAAMILQEIDHWVQEKAKEQSPIHFHDGAYWIWNTYKSWEKVLPFIPEVSIRKIIVSLEAQGILISGEFNRNKGNRTKWYRIDYAKLGEIIKPAKLRFESFRFQQADLIDHMGDLSDHMGMIESISSPDRIDQVGMIESISSPDRIDLLCTTDLSTDLSTDPTTKKEKSNFSSSQNSQIQESQKNQALGSDRKEDPIPPTPLSRSPEILEKQIPSDPMGNRFKSGRAQNRFAPQGLIDAGFGRWHLGEQYNNWNPHIVDAAIARKRDLKQSTEPSKAKDYVTRMATECYRSQHWGLFETLVEEAIAIEKAQERLQEQQVEPRTTTTMRSCLWKPIGRRVKAEQVEFMWERYPSEEQLTADDAIAELNAFVDKCAERGFLEDLVSGNHVLARNSKAPIDEFGQVLAQYVPFLQHQARLKIQSNQVAS
ncbi:hypothetical protein [Pseudanabaena sp. 'Roaring Creek']|uniref:hypothetical protein n=1 Tax=Pseudanabaena sp. 'Roaring Creek' TaxID=1681830 RepID=UPI0006D81775|nr:hypothetical protein [Pseudanabaena sp. 'Roaring Creek']